MVVFVGQNTKNQSDSSYGHRLLEEQYCLLTQEAALPPLAREEKGKPYFPQPTALPFVQHFNLSHSKGFVALAFGAAPLGLDLQVPVCPSPKLIQRVCSLSEQQWLKEHPTDFATLWAMKEAYLKWKGEGVGSGRSLSLLDLPLPEKTSLTKGTLRFHLWREEAYSLVLCSEEEETVSYQNI